MIKDFFKKWSPSEGCPWMNNVSLFVMTLLFGSASSNHLFLHIVH